MSFQDVIDARLGDVLTERGFERIQHAIDNRAFGNEFVIFRSPSVMLRFVRDRSDLFIEVGPSSGEEHWCDFSLLEQLLKVAGAPITTDAGGRDGIVALRETLRLRYDDLVNLFSPTAVNETLRKVREMKSTQVESFLKGCGLTPTELQRAGFGQKSPR